MILSFYQVDIVHNVVRMKDGKNKVRAERQEYRNQEYVDAIVRKLYPNGHLADPAEFSLDRRSEV